MNTQQTPALARISGSGFDPETGGFAHLSLDGVRLETRQVAALPELIAALERANRVFAELAHSSFIVGDDYGSIDMRQRIRAAHEVTYAAIAKIGGHAFEQWLFVSASFDMTGYALHGLGLVPMVGNVASISKE